MAFFRKNVLKGFGFWLAREKYQQWVRSPLSNVMARCLTLSVAGNECILWPAMELRNSWESQLPAVQVSIFKAHWFQWECSRMSHMPVQRVWQNFSLPETPQQHQHTSFQGSKIGHSFGCTMVIKYTFVNISDGILFTYDVRMLHVYAFASLCARCRQEALQHLSDSVDSDMRSGSAFIFSHFTPSLACVTLPPSPRDASQQEPFVRDVHLEQLCHTCFHVLLDYRAAGRGFEAPLFLCLCAMHSGN